MHHISIFHPSSDSKTEPKSISSIMNQTCDLKLLPLINEHAIYSRLSYIHLEPKQPSLQEINPYKMRVVFCKPVHALRVKSGPPGPTHDSFTAKPGSHHVHVTLWVMPPPFLCPTLSADAEPMHKCAVTIFSAQCAV